MEVVLSVGGYWLLVLGELDGEIRKGQEGRRGVVGCAAADEIKLCTVPICVKPRTWIQEQHGVGENVAESDLVAGRIFGNV